MDIVTAIATIIMIMATTTIMTTIMTTIITIIEIIIATIQIDVTRTIAITDREAANGIAITTATTTTALVDLAAPTTITITDGVVVDITARAQSSTVKLASRKGRIEADGLFLPPTRMGVIGEVYAVNTQTWRTFCIFKRANSRL